MDTPVSPRTTTWTSRLGFILTTAGAAIGFGNIQRFPQVAAQHGGGTFLLLYLLCVIGLAWPLMLAELAIGRAGGKDPITSMQRLMQGTGHANFEPTTGQGWLWDLLDRLPFYHRKWSNIAWLAVLTAFSILSYYGVLCAQTLLFTLRALYTPATTFAATKGDVGTLMVALALFYACMVVILSQGLNRGLERFSTVVVPLLLFMQLLLLLRVLTLPGSLQGVAYYLWPDPAHLTWSTLFHALAHAFFSLCIGEAVLMTYGSYLGAEEDLPKAAIYIALFDTMVAFFSGLIVLPALATMDLDPATATDVVYVAIPAMLQDLPLGTLLQGTFFAVLLIAGLTTALALLEVVSATITQHLGWPKPRCVVLVALAAYIVGLPSLYSAAGLGSPATLMVGDIEGFHNIMDFVWGSLAMVVGGFGIALFTGWVWGTERAIQELTKAAPWFAEPAKWWGRHMQYGVPLVLFALLVTL